MAKKAFYYFIILLTTGLLTVAIVTITGRGNRSSPQPAAVYGFDTLECISSVTINAYRLNNVHLRPVTLAAYTDQGACPLSKVIGNRSTIVLQYSDLNCDICVDSALSYLTAFLKKTGTSNVVIIASTDNRRLLSFFVRINHIDPRIVYYINNKGLTGLYGTEVPNAPFVYFTDSTLSVSDAFFPVREIPRLSEIYYNEMLAKHFGKKEAPNTHWN